MYNMEQECNPDYHIKYNHCHSLDKSTCVNIGDVSGELEIEQD